MFDNLSKSRFEYAINPSSSKHDSKVDHHNPPTHSSSEFGNHTNEHPLPKLRTPNDSSYSLKTKSNPLPSSSLNLTSLCSKSSLIIFEKGRMQILILFQRRNQHC